MVNLAAISRSKTSWPVLTGNVARSGAGLLVAL